jgi:hypothetical protein
VTADAREPGVLSLPAAGQTLQGQAAASPETTADAQRWAIRDLIMLLGLSSYRAAPLPQPERVDAVREVARLLGVEIRIVEADDSSKRTTPTECSEPTAQEPPPAPTPASEPHHATVAPPREPAAASPEPGGKTGWKDRKPPVPCNLRDGSVCGYTTCAAIGCCQVAPAEVPP